VSGEIKRILIMEDSDIFADVLSGSFDPSRYVLQRAVNGFDGIKKVYSFLPHLIITDIEMPLLKGYHVTRLLKARRHTKTIPVIMFTTLGQTKDKFWGLQSGSDFFIEKSPGNLKPLMDAVENILSKDENIDFGSIEREGKKINDESIIEIVNNLLDNKLFQTTIIGLLADLSGKVHSMNKVAREILELLTNICEVEIVSLLICGNNRQLYSYTSNFSGFTGDISKNFKGICTADFNNIFPEYKFINDNSNEFYPSGKYEKKISSYISLPLIIAGKNFASVHIGNTINDYFSPGIMENLNVFLASASPVIANALSMHEMKELQINTRTAFARYVPADVMDQIINDSVSKANMSEKRNVSVLFADIRRFTELTEHLDAQIVVEFLNNFFSKMGSDIISEGGHIDKFIGDAIMAVFGAINTEEYTPLNAIKAAVKMLVALDYINSSGAKLNNDNIHIGIGINCGQCTIGNIGFKNKMDYTIIGDTVNLASRVESLTKIYHHPLLVTEYVFDETKEDFLYRKVDNVRVKGKNKPVGIYAVYSGFSDDNGKRLRSGKISDLPLVPSLLINRETLSNFNKGLRVFYLREFKLACEYFSKALEYDKSDYLSGLYLERSVEFDKTAPDENWDGVITLEKK